MKVEVDREIKEVTRVSLTTDDLYELVMVSPKCPISGSPGSAQEESRFQFNDEVMDDGDELVMIVTRTRTEQS